MNPLSTKEEYDKQMAEAAYAVMGWDETPPEPWDFELDETGTKLVSKGRVNEPQLR